MKLLSAMLCCNLDCNEVFSAVERPHLDCPSCGESNPFPLSRAVEKSNGPGKSHLVEMSQRDRAKVARLRLQSALRVTA